MRDSYIVDRQIRGITALQPSTNTADEFSTPGDPKRRHDPNYEPREISI